MSLQYLRFVKNSLKILDGSSTFLSQSIAPNEIARRFVGESMALEVKKLEGRQIENMVIDTMGGGKVRSPSQNSLITGNDSNTKIVDFKVAFISILLTLLQ